MIENIKSFLDSKVTQYNRPEFIPNDPVCIPHLFSKKQDIEIMGLWAAVLAWGQRVTIINKCHELIKLMDGAPYDFIMGHEETDLKKLLQFKHRTFNDVDTLYFISFFRHHYSTFESLESAFLPPYVILSDSEGTYKSGITANAATPSSVILSHSEGTYKSGITVNAAIPPFVILSDSEGTSTSDITANAASPEPVEIYLNHFRQYFFSLQDFPNRTKKHISSPSQKSTCKRLNMFLRWMVRKDDCGVDFGLWDKIKPADLICPCDLHVDRVARKLNLITRKQTDWQTAMELTARLREFDPIDPVKYDFALFGLGIVEKF